MLLVFDLDGTLIDSAADLAISMNATRRHFGLAPLDPKLICSYVGNGAAVLVRRAIVPDAGEAVLDDALAFFLKFYRAHALEHTRLYPGVGETVESLAQGGHTLGVLTNKPARISSDIIAALGLQLCFARVYGGDSFASKKPDPIGIVTLMNAFGAARECTMMIGDSSVDVQTARNAGVRSCGVSWGFQPDTFALEAPDIVISSPSELLR
ncbi:MAG: HAD hydrolase-like protein, partial [Acidobacteriaceae bacterium]|nr:HAD hydrolase-like protein [Acidobacteriaceae bacterium]